MKAIFKGRPIATVEALARSLNVSPHELRTLAGASSSLYRDFEIEKRDGGVRRVSGPTPELKIVQKRLNRQIFERVEFPKYLYGSIQERDYVQNARSHSNAHVVISVDVRDFFPSIKRQVVLEIFKHFFKFPESVSEIVANLCTKDGCIPQGACTSSYIANLALFDIEPRLAFSLKEQGLNYSRLIDDISVSSSREISKKRVSDIIERIASMLKSKGFDLKRKKTKVHSKSNPKDLMEITGLWLNRGEPRVKRDERLEIRKAVRQCILLSKVERTSEEYHALHDRTSGRVAKLMHLKHPEAKRFRRALRLTLPHYSASEVKRTKAMVTTLCKTPVKTRNSIPYVERFFKTQYRISIISRTQPLLATELRKKLKPHAPSKRKDDIIHGN